MSEHEPPADITSSNISKDTRKHFNIQERGQKVQSDDEGMALHLKSQPMDSLARSELDPEKSYSGDSSVLKASGRGDTTQII